MIGKNRLFSEVYYTCGLRIGELLALRSADIVNNSISIPDLKVCGPRRVLFLPEQLSKKLDEYIRQNSLPPTGHLFPIKPIQAQIIIDNFCKENGFKSRRELREQVKENLRRKILPRKR